MSKVFALCTTDLEVYAFYLVTGKLITSITINFMFFFIIFIELGIGLQKNFGQKIV